MKFNNAKNTILNVGFWKNEIRNNKLYVRKSPRIFILVRRFEINKCVQYCHVMIASII